MKIEKLNQHPESSIAPVAGYGSNQTQIEKAEPSFSYREPNGLAALADQNHPPSHLGTSTRWRIKQNLC